MGLGGWVFGLEALNHNSVLRVWRALRVWTLGLRGDKPETLAKRFFASGTRAYSCPKTSKPNHKKSPLLS